MSDTPIYSMGVAAAMCGLTPHVLRVWERRYGAVVPTRSTGNQRLYSAVQVARLSALRGLTEAGHKIGQIAALPDERLRDLAREVGESNARHRLAAFSDDEATPNDSATTRDLLMHYHSAALAAIRGLDASALDAILIDAQVHLSQTHLIDDLLMPLMEAVGDHWQTGDLRAAHEHLATHHVKSCLHDLRSVLTPAVGAPVAVVTTPVGQLHEIGALAAAAVVAAQGWRPLYLGPNLPADEIVAAVRQCDARLVLLSLIHPADDPRLLPDLRKLRRLLPATPVILGGRAAVALQRDIAGAGLRHLASFAGLRSLLRQMQGGDGAAAERGAGDSHLTASRRQP